MLRKLVDFIGKEVEEDGAPDLVAITGDIAHSGSTRVGAGMQCVCVADMVSLISQLAPIVELRGFATICCAVSDEAA